MANNKEIVVALFQTKDRFIFLGTNVENLKKIEVLRITKKEIDFEKYGMIIHFGLDTPKEKDWKLLEAKHGILKEDIKTDNY